VYAFMQSFEFEAWQAENNTIEPIRELFQKLQEWDANIGKYVKPLE
jgi:hypothetical protein